MNEDGQRRFERDMAAAIETLERLKQAAKDMEAEAEETTESLDELERPEKRITPRGAGPGGTKRTRSPRDCLPRKQDRKRNTEE